MFQVFVAVQTLQGREFHGIYFPGREMESSSWTVTPAGKELFSLSEHPTLKPDWITEGSLGSWFVVPSDTFLLV